MVSAYDPDRAADPSLLGERLDNLRLALGADRLGLARRLSSFAESGGAGPFEILACAVEKDEPAREVPIPVEIVHRLMSQARPLDLRDANASSLQPVFRAWGCERILGWPLPPDRRPSIFAVALLGDGPDPGPIRIRTALAGLEALARALAPPDWLPLARPRSVPGADGIARSALLAGSSPAVVELRRVCEELSSPTAPVLVEGPPGSGRRELAQVLCGRAQSPAVVTARELEDEPQSRLVLELEELSARQQEVLFETLHEDSPRPWIFLVTDRLRRCVEAGSFRSDLYWRLAERRLTVPALATRAEDVVPIAHALWRGWTGEQIEISPDVEQCLQAFAWPGHYQQLRAEMRRLLARHPRARRLRRSWLSLSIRRGTGPISGEESLAEALERFERTLLQRALRVAEGNKTLAARRLRVSRQGLYRKLRHHGLLAGASSSEGGTADDVGGECR